MSKKKFFVSDGAFLLLYINENVPFRTSFKLSVTTPVLLALTRAVFLWHKRRNIRFSRPRGAKRFSRTKTFWLNNFVQWHGHARPRNVLGGRSPGVLPTPVALAAEVTVASAVGTRRGPATVTVTAVRTRRPVSGARVPVLSGGAGGGRAAPTPPRGRRGVATSGTPGPFSTGPAATCSRISSALSSGVSTTVTSGPMGPAVGLLADEGRRGSVSPRATRPPVGRRSSVTPNIILSRPTASDGGRRAP